MKKLLLILQIICIMIMSGCISNEEIDISEITRSLEKSGWEISISDDGTGSSVYLNLKRNLNEENFIYIDEGINVNGKIVDNEDNTKFILVSLRYIYNYGENKDNTDSEYLDFLFTENFDKPDSSYYITFSGEGKYEACYYYSDGTTKYANENLSSSEGKKCEDKLKKKTKEIYEVNNQKFTELLSEVGITKEEFNEWIKEYCKEYIESKYDIEIGDE